MYPQTMFHTQDLHLTFNSSTNHFPDTARAPLPKYSIPAGVFSPGLKQQWISLACNTAPAIHSYHELLFL